MSNSPDRIAFKLVETALSRLVVRAGIYYADWPPRQLVSIYLFSLCKPSMSDRGGRVFEVSYCSPTDPTSWYGDDDVVSVRSLDPVIVGSSYEPEFLIEPAREMERRLAGWQDHHPPWDSDREVVAYNKELQGDRYDEVYPSNLRLMLHFVRLHGLLLARGQNTPNAWETDDLLKRLGAFLKDRMQDWEKVLG